MDVSESEFDEMCEVAFARFDEDGSGGLDLEEIVRAFQKLPLRETSEDEVRARFTKHDVDRSGALDLAEFRDLMRELRRKTPKKRAQPASRAWTRWEAPTCANVVSIAEVKLKLRADERDEAMAHILALVNEGRFVRGGLKGGPRESEPPDSEHGRDLKASDKKAVGDAGEYAGNQRSPLARAPRARASRPPAWRWVWRQASRRPPGRIPRAMGGRRIHRRDPGATESSSSRVPSRTP